MERKSDEMLDVEIYGYCRISVDDELDKDNTSIENQKSIIADFCRRKFPKCRVLFYEDRDKSGYTFEQREGYQKLRVRLMEKNKVKILIVKDFSRFSRRNSKGLVELEDLRDAGVRIISIGDSIDYPTFDDWTAIQFRFLINEMPVTDASKKVRSVIKRRQEEGKWLCTVPYGYVITNMKKQEIALVPDEANVIRKVFSLYIEGWGYKRIANYLTDQKIPTPRMKEKERIEARGDDYKRKQTKTAWSIVTVQGILTNDFYIGTLRQHKYKRKKINGTDMKVSEEENFVFEHHHEAIIDDKTWRLSQELLKQRTTSHYRGNKKYDNVYSGFMFCGDCGSPMFSMSRPDIAPAYTCGTYHKRGRAGCTSHHTRVDMLDAILKEYVKKVRDNSEGMLKKLENSVKNEATELQENETTISLLQRYLTEAKEEYKALQKRKIKEIAKLEASDSPGASARIEIIEETYQELEDEVTMKICGLQNQIKNTSDKRNDIVRINRVARTVIDVFNDILQKENLDRTDLQLIIDRIIIYEGRIDVRLKADVAALLQLERQKQEIAITEESPEPVETVNPETMPVREDDKNFKSDSKVILQSGGGHPAVLTVGEVQAKDATTFRLKARNQAEQLFAVNVVNSGDPLEIFTDREGGIILKKYSTMEDLSDFAGKYADALAQTTGCIVAIADREKIIAASGSGRKELLYQGISSDLEKLIDERENILSSGMDQKYRHIASEETPFLYEAIHPIICEGDAVGAVILLSRNAREPFGDTEKKLAATAANFLGKQMEQ